MIAADIHNGHVYHHQLQSRRVKLTTGNAISMRLCLLLLFDQVKNTQKLKRYEPKCPTKNQSTLPFFKLSGCLLVLLLSVHDIDQLTQFLLPENSAFLCLHRQAITTQLLPARRICGILES